MCAARNTRYTGGCRGIIPPEMQEALHFRDTMARARLVRRRPVGESRHVEPPLFVAVLEASGSHLFGLYISCLINTSQTTSNGTAIIDS